MKVQQHRRIHVVCVRFGNVEGVVSCLWSDLNTAFGSTENGCWQIDLWTCIGIVGLTTRSWRWARDCAGCQYYDCEETQVLRNGSFQCLLQSI